MAKTALVTGASSGIGREIARDLSARGFRVIISARREERLRELAEQVIAKHMGDFIVTPKDIDVIVEDMAGIIANAINSALFGNNLEQVRNMLA